MYFKYKDCVAKFERNENMKLDEMCVIVVDASC